MRTNRTIARGRRKRRIRGKMGGTAVRPRLAVFRSVRHIYAQVVDDGAGVTMAAASSLDPALRKGKIANAIDAAKRVGTLIAQRALERSVKRVVFDRGGNLYHGRVKALAEAARAGGLEF